MRLEEVKWGPVGPEAQVMGSARDEAAIRVATLFQFLSEKSHIQRAKVTRSPLEVCLKIFETSRTARDGDIELNVRRVIAWDQPLQSHSVTLSVGDCTVEVSLKSFSECKQVNANDSWMFEARLAPVTLLRFSPAKPASACGGCNA